MRLTFVALFAATLYLSLSGFECASTEMSTARVALSHKDYDKAEASLKKEVGARPNNGEAWNMLAEIYHTQNKLREMNDAYDKALVATEPALSPNERDNVYASRYNAWLEFYNSGLKKYNSNDYAAALEKFDNAAAVRSDYPGNVYMRGLSYRGLKNEDMEMKAYGDYITLAGPDIDKGVAAGLSLGMSRADVETKVGKAFKTVIDSTGHYGFYRDKDLYVYYNEQEAVEGWRYYNNAKIPDFIRETSSPLTSAPYYSLGVVAYLKGEKNPAMYDEALKRFQFVQRLDRQQEKVGDIIADIYAKTNRTDEAKRSFEEAIRQSPKDPSLYINYGSLLLSMKDYQGAIGIFQKVVEMLPATEEKHQTALFNIGAVNKNWAAELQKKYGDKPTKAQTDEINDKVRQSARAFEAYRKAHGDGDFAVLVELGNLYYVLADKAKFNDVLGALENLKADNGSNSDYWAAMSRLYLIKGDVKKSEDAMKKSEEIRGR